MELILITNNRPKRFQIGRLGFFMVMLTALVMIAGTMGAGTYFGRSMGRVESTQAVQLWKGALVGQHAVVVDARRSAEDHLDALALRLGRLQAHMTRLDALGLRLTKMAKLDAGEFDFSHPPAVGGPVTGGAVAANSVPDFLDDLEQLAHTLNDRIPKLEVIEEVLLDRHLQTQSRPAGRPIERGWLSSHFGFRNDPFTGKRAFHEGMDFAGKAGSGVVAVAAGIVTRVGHQRGFGRFLEINHGNGLVTRYGHNREVLVEVGETVPKGKRIALMGSTGRSTGPHLHFEVLRNGKPINPTRFIRSKG